MFMKNLFKVLTVCTVAVMTLSSCNCFTKMAKNQDDIALTCVPEVLVLNNGKVDAAITVTFPEKYFNAKPVIPLQYTLQELILLLFCMKAIYQVVN